MSLRAILRPTSIKMMQLISRNKYKTSTRPQASQFKSVITLVANYAFLWPLTKITQLTNTTKAEKPKPEVLNDKKAIIDTADNLFENGHYHECYLKLIESKQKDDVEVQWRLVRALYNMSKDPKYNKKEKQAYIFQAFDIITKLLAYHPDHNAVHKWYALILDTKSSYEGVSERIKQLENVKKHMDLAVTLNPEDATCLHMLGEWCYQITEMPWHQRKIAELLFATPPNSSYEDALEYFLRAEAVQPRFYSINLLRIGSCYLNMGKEDQAKYYLKLAASYPAKSNDDHRANKEAAESLKKLLKKEKHK